MKIIWCSLVLTMAHFYARAAIAADLTPIRYNHPGLVVDAGLGLLNWPIPCDRNGDSLTDLVAITSGPARGVYYFENTGRRDAASGADILKAPVRIGDARNDIRPSYTRNGIRILSPGVEYFGFIEHCLRDSAELPIDPESIHRIANPKAIRGNQWSYADFDGDERLDLVVGIEDMSDNGWDNAYDANGRWTNGPLHGYVYVIRNEGTNEKPKYAEAFRLEADRRPVDVFGLPSPVFADFRGIGKLDLICGEFLDGLTFFENIGTRQQPRYATGRRLRHNGQPLAMHLEKIGVVAYDWNRDQRVDLVVGQEDGRAALFENTGRVTQSTMSAGPKGVTTTSSMPEFLSARFFRQEARLVKFGALSSPVPVDWDGDGRVDLLSGDSAGELGFIRNLGGNPPRWEAPRLLETDGKPIRIMAGGNGSIQGPAEAKWGYTNIGVGDWDGDGLDDIVANTILGKVIWFRNVGSRSRAELARPRSVRVDWPDDPPKPAWNWWDPDPHELATQWRSTPCVIDLDRDGMNDLVSLDHEGYLAFFRQVQRDGRRVLQPGQRIFRADGPSVFDQRHEPDPSAAPDGLLRLNYREAGQSGRRTFCFADWDGDGKLDLMVNSVNANFLRNVSERKDEWIFRDEGPVSQRRLAGHSTAPCIVDWDDNGIPDLLIGAEDGHFYYLHNPRSN